MNQTADLVVVGGGTIGGWAAWFARTDGLERVVVVERGLVGAGASSRAAGMVRAQGGSPEAIALGRWTIDFYRAQAALLGTDSGFRELGYLILARDEADEQAGRERVALQNSLGLPSRWVDAAEAARLVPTLAPAGHRGGSFLATDGCVDPPRNVLAYSLALRTAGVELWERTAVTGVRMRDGQVAGVDTERGPIEAPRVLLTGGPGLRAVGRLAGLEIPAGGARHTIAVLEPHDAFAVEQPMVFDIAGGMYWRLEDGGLLVGWSLETEPPGEARAIDWPAYERVRDRLAGLVPVTRDLGTRRIWAATIDFTPDHRPIIGPGVTPAGEGVDGLTVAAAGGHGMMWGPAVSRAAVDIALRGRTDVVDTTRLGLDRFDEHGRSRFAPDPVAVPFPVATGGGSGEARR